MRQYLITIGLLAAALAFYALSLPIPAVCLTAAALVLESAFWIRVLVSRPLQNDFR